MSKFKIEVILGCSGEFLILHPDYNLSAIITDTASEKEYIVNWGSVGIDPYCFQKSITLYSDVEGTLEAFIKKFEKDFASIKFNRVTHNCSSAVDFVLDHFFPDTAALNTICFVDSRY